MDTAVRPIGNVGSAEPVESEIKRLPWIRQKRIGFFIGGGGGCQKLRSTKPCKANTLTR